ncbi:MAG TPA: polysaccharide deacetylase family protein [Acidimicrobiales bacterium]|nr:polysaccharide deacetylase family protein [Acidimicrobiales bacterium]
MAAASVRWFLAGSAAAAMALTGLVAMHPAGAAGSGPAFYTWQAPGGSTTAGARVIALTFNDGPSPYTPAVLSVLQQYHVPATFFEVGEEVANYPQDARLLTAAGYPVENHTWSHPDLTKLSSAAVGAQIDRTQAEIGAVTGTTPLCLRPPYDAFNASVLSQVAARGMTTMSYPVDSKDWTRPGVPAIAQAVVGAAFPGAVVGMHDGGGDRSETVAALPQIITQLRAEGYAFVSICDGNSGPQVTATYNFGDAPTPGPPVTSNLPLVGAAFEGTAGYWEVASDGGIFSFANAQFHGSMGGQPLNAPIVGMAAGPNGAGYWQLAADGGVFAFEVPFLGSRGGQSSVDRFFAITATPDGGGYLLAGQHPPP